MCEEAEAFWTTFGVTQAVCGLLYFTPILGIMKIWSVKVYFFPPKIKGFLFRFFLVGGGGAGNREKREEAKLY